MKFNLSIFLYFLVFNFSVARAAQIEIVQFPISELIGVQPRDHTSVILDLGVIYPNGCYKPDTVVNLDDLENQKIYLLHKAEKTNGPCTMSLVKIAILLEIPVPGTGTFTLFDFVSKQKLGTIVITNQMTTLAFKCSEFCD